MIDVGGLELTFHANRWTRLGMNACMRGRLRLASVDRRRPARMIVTTMCPRPPSVRVRTRTAHRKPGESPVNSKEINLSEINEAYRM